MRKLASIQKITALNPIEGADKIEVADILGWKVVVEKGKFEIGQDVVYFEIDSVLPKKPQFEHMAKYNYRVRTIKLRGQISQGLCMKISEALGTIWDLNIGNGVGADVTNIIGVTKYEPNPDNTTNNKNVFEASKKKWVKRYIPKKILSFIFRHAPKLARAIFCNKITNLPFPSFIPKTDEERIQSIESERLSEMLEEEYQATEKLDGTSCTMYLKDGKFGVCSRNRELKEDSSAYWQVAKKYDIKNKLKKLQDATNCEYAIQGEIIGPAIQGNKYKLKELRFYIFNVYEMSTKKYLANEHAFDKVKYMELEHVPWYCPTSNGNGFKFVLKKHTIDEIVAMSDGQSAINKDVLREGLVWRSEDGWYTKHSFKAVSNKFLLKNGE